MDVEEFFSELRSAGSLTPRLVEEAIRLFGDRGGKALSAIGEGRVKKYLDFYVVVGRSDEYIVDEDFCTCNDFIFRGGRCWHILAVQIAALTGRYESYDLWYQEIWGGESGP